MCSVDTLPERQLYIPRLLNHSGNIIAIALLGGIRMPGDTSFAIHPDNHPQKEAVDFFDIGNILKTVRIQNGLFMETESGEMKILVYREGIIRFLYKPGGTAAEETTPAVTARPGRVHFSVQETEEKVFLGTKKLTVEIHKNPCRVATPTG